MEEQEPTTRENPSLDDSATVLHDHSSAAHIAPGRRVGHYTIREVLGEGGFAVVYLAEQTEPVRRHVALKVIKLGMDTKQVIARFEVERQALAMMDHPNVAKVFDAGSTETGRPYFVMELVKGVSITEHCDRQRLNIQERLELFMQVCEAVQHAHQKGIIHRDLKPGNVLVSVKEGKPLVKVIDFGVAKAISHRLTEKTLYTEQGQLIGTPEYMSPEQAEMTAQDIDTRSDIYTLGVLLYELLTGALPFDPTTLRQAAFGEIQRIIREQEPPKPSTRLSSLGDESTTYAQQRRADPMSLLRELRGDLDWITMKALEKDRTRRYATALELSRDVARHLGGDAIEAAPPSSLYRMSRFLRKHKLVVNLIASIGLGLPTVVMVWLAVASLLLAIAPHSQDPEKYAAIAALVLMLLILVVMPLGLAVISVLLWRIDRGRYSLVNVILGGAWIASIAAFLFIFMPSTGWGSGPSRMQLAQQYEREGRYEDAEALYLKELESSRRGLGWAHERAAKVLQSLVDLYDAGDKPRKAAEWGAKLPDARPFVAELIALRKRAADRPDADARELNSYAWLLLTCEPADLRDPETALRLARDACAMTDNASPTYLDTLALAQHLTGDTAAAIETETKALSLLPADTPGRGDYEAALAKFQAALENESK